MTVYNYNEFVHPVPEGCVIPKGTPVRSVDPKPFSAETFFTMQNDDFLVHPSDETKFYLTYDITAPELPEKINSVIYNVRAYGSVYPVAVYQGSRIWSAFSYLGERTTLYTPEIGSFSTTPPKDEAGDDDEHA